MNNNDTIININYNYNRRQSGKYRMLIKQFYDRLLVMYSDDKKIKYCNH